MKKIIFLLFLLPNFLQAQNILPNGDFEEEIICEEYNLNCGPLGWRLTSFDPPEYYGDFENEDSTKRNHWTSFVPFSYAEQGRYREYLQSPLLCSLKKGTAYRLSFQLKAKEIAVKEIDILFTPMVTITHFNQIIVANPSVKLINEKFWIDENDKWINVKTRYIADGTEKYILIGNLQPQELTAHKRIYNVQHNKFMSVYYIDNVYLTPEEGVIRIDSDYLKLLHTNRKRHTMDTSDFFPMFSPINKVPVAENKDKTVVEAPFIIENINFESNKYTLLPSSFKALDSLAGILNKNNNLSLEITGHTDSSGLETNNVSLSRNRAEAVQNYLISKGIEGYRLTSTGHSSLNPIAPNNTPQGRKINRRVECIFHNRKEQLTNPPLKP